MRGNGKQRTAQAAAGKHRLRPAEKAELDVVNSLSTSRLKAAIRQSKRFIARVRATYPSLR